jgi:hypothetical protein
LYTHETSKATGEQMDLKLCMAQGLILQL